MSNYTTGQEVFWAGEFGDQYSVRNSSKDIVCSDINLFANILKHTHGIENMIEFGANRGMNLLAVKSLLPNIRVSALEINKTAVMELQHMEGVTILHQSMLDYVPDSKFDFVLSKGLLIHINPSQLRKIYNIIYQSCKKYICFVEYYNPTPVSIVYRGHEEKLFKRDFAGEMMDLYSDLELVDYGFVYRRDPNFPQDDVTWFLLKKKEEGI